MSKNINWASRLATEAAAEVKSNLRTKPSERKRYKARAKGLHHIAETSRMKRTLGNGNSETRNLTPSH